MAAFSSSKIFHQALTDLGPVAQDVIKHFEHQGYEVKGEKTIIGGWHISVSKGKLFKAVVGMKTALNINIEPSGNSTSAKAGVGIWGTQAIPTAITVLLLWPIAITQIWGMVQQSKLDEEALDCIESSLARHGGVMPTAATASEPSAAEQKTFCTACGAQVPKGSKFCPGCGVSQTSAGPEGPY